MVRSKLIDVYNTYVFSWTPSIGATNNQDALPPRLNCAAATVHTGKDFYGPFGMGYSEFVAQDVQGYDIMQHFESCLRKKRGCKFEETLHILNSSRAYGRHFFH